MMEMNNSKVHNRVTLCEAGPQMCGADFISLLHTCVQGELQLFRQLDAHPPHQLLHDGEHAVLDVEVNGVRQEMLEHTPWARLGTQDVGLSASVQHIAQCVVV